VTPNRLYTSLPVPMYIYAHCLFRMLFYLLIAIRLSGCKVAIKLIDWLKFPLRIEKADKADGTSPDNLWL